MSAFAMFAMSSALVAPVHLHAIVNTESKCFQLSFVVFYRDVVYSPGIPILVLHVVV